MAKCDIATLTIESSSWTVSTQIVNLLADTNISVNYPTITAVKPTGCSYSVTSWVAKQTSDDQDVTLVFPGVFTLNDSNNRLDISHTGSDIAKRKTLFGNRSFYFKGTVNNPSSTMTT